MKSKLVRLSLLAIIAAFASVTFMPVNAAFSEAAHEKRIKQAAALLEKMGKETDADSLADTIHSGVGVAIFPKVIQGGLGFGGMAGEGIVLLKKGKSWNGPSFASLTGGSFGLQIGIEEIGLILVITNENGLSAFTGGKSFKLGADVSIAAGPVGRDAAAATDSSAKASIYSYSISKGLFAGISLSGSAINVNGDANKAYWGSALDAKAALSRPASGAKINPLVNKLNSLLKATK
ncbi:hypothetical protein FACS1894216_09420 [Synergistales bacterium]|nr:hypothetical protein FACS1894216_09420 [Synergistales bacterium]